MQVSTVQAVKTRSVVTDRFYYGVRSAATNYFGISMQADALEDLKLERDADRFDSENPRHTP